MCILCYICNVCFILFFTPGGFYSLQFKCFPSVWVAGWVVWKVLSCNKEIKSFFFLLHCCVWPKHSHGFSSHGFWFWCIEVHHREWVVCVQVTVTLVFSGLTASCWQVTSSVSIRAIIICSLHLHNKMQFLGLQCRVLCACICSNPNMTQRVSSVHVYYSVFNVVSFLSFFFPPSISVLRGEMQLSMCAFLAVSSPASYNCAAVTHILMGKQILMCFCDNRSHYTLPVLTDFDGQHFDGT